MLNHVIKNKQTELLPLLVVGAKSCGQHGVLELGHKLVDELNVRLEQNAHQLSRSELKVKLVVVLLNSLERLVDNP